MNPRGGRNHGHHTPVTFAKRTLPKLLGWRIMKDQRLKVFRNAVEQLIESLEASIRLARWDANEAKPDPLVAAAAKLLDRLGAADRLSSARYQGSPAEVAKVDAMRGAMKRLESAYAAYRKEAKPGGDIVAAVAALESEVGAVAGTSHSWA